MTLNRAQRPARYAQQAPAPVAAAQRLRQGSANSARGARQLVRGALAGLVVRRVPDFNRPGRPCPGGPIHVVRFHAFFITSGLDTVTADKSHRGHAIIEPASADL